MSDQNKINGKPLEFGNREQIEYIKSKQNSMPIDGEEVEFESRIDLTIQYECIICGRGNCEKFEDYDELIDFKDFIGCCGMKYRFSYDTLIIVKQ